MLDKQKVIRKVRKLRLKLFFAIIVLVLLVLMAIIGVQARLVGINGGDGFESGESHCALGGLGLLLVLGTLAAGFLVSGRFGRITGFKPLPAHKLVVLVMALYLTGEFIYGLTVRNLFFLNSLHGTLGFLTISITWLTVSINPLAIRRVIKWKIASGLHLILASSLFVILIIHLSYAFSIFGD